MPFSYTRTSIPQAGNLPGASSRLLAASASQPQLAVRPQVAGTQPLGQRSFQHRLHHAGGSVPDVARGLLSQGIVRSKSAKDVAVSPKDRTLALKRGLSLIDLRRNELEIPDKAVCAPLAAETKATLKSLAPESLDMTKAYVEVAKRRPESAGAKYDMMWDEAFTWQRIELFRLLRVHETNEHTALARVRRTSTKQLEQQLQAQMNRGSLSLARRNRELARQERIQSQLARSNRDATPLRTLKRSSPQRSPSPAARSASADSGASGGGADGPDVAVGAAKLAREELPPWVVPPRNETRFARRTKALGAAVVGTSDWWRVVRGDDLGEE